MANEIPITDLTNGSVIAKEWVGTGVFDVLLSTMNENIELQYTQGRIVGKDYADVYLSGLQATLQQSVEFLLRKDLVYWQIEVAQKELEIKQLEVKIREAELNSLKDLKEAELEKHWGYDVTRDVDDNLVLGANLSNGKIDSETDALIKEIEVKEQQLLNLITENKVMSQKIVGRAQSAVTLE